MSDIVVSATRGATEVRRFSEPAAISLIIPNPMERGTGRVTADLLREAPGVHVQQTSAGQGAVILRGLVGNQVLLMVDGIPLNNGTYRDGPGQYLATIDPESVERIEVIRGPGSVLYGSDAQGGVVNIITRPHPITETGRIRFSGNLSGANDGARGRFSTAVGGGSWLLAAGASVASAGNLSAGGDMPDQSPTGFTAEGVDLRLDLTPAPRHHLTIVTQHFAMHDVPRYDRYVDFRAPVPGRDAQHLFDPQTRQLAYFRYRYTPATPLLHSLETTVSLAVQREHRIRQRLRNGQGDPRVERTRDDVYTPGISVVGSSLLMAGRVPVSLTWGGDLYHDNLNSSGSETDFLARTVTPINRTAVDGSPLPAGRFPDDANATRAGLFVSGEARPISWLLVTGGGRWSTFRNEADVGRAFGGRVENTSSDLTAQLGAVASLPGNLSVGGRVAGGFRAPNLYDLTNVGPVPGGVALPNPDAVPEKSLSAEGSLRYLSSGTAASLTFYRTTIDDFIDRTTGTFLGDTLFEGERVFQGKNVGAARVWGVEFEGAYQLNQWEFRTSLLYTRGDQSLAGTIREPMSKIPPLKGTARLRYDVTPRISVEYDLRWAGPQRRLGRRDLRDTRIPPGGTDGYTVHAARISFESFNGITVSSGFENIADRLYRDHASGVDNPGRHVWLGVTWLGNL